MAEKMAEKAAEKTAEKTFMLEALRKMSKSDLENLAKSLHIVVSGLTKPEIIDKMISTGQIPQTVMEDTTTDRLVSVGDTHELEIDEGEITIPLDPKINTDVALDRDWKVKLEFMILEAEVRQRELDREERERARYLEIAICNMNIISLSFRQNSFKYLTIKRNFFKLRLQQNCYQNLLQTKNLIFISSYLERLQC